MARHITIYKEDIEIYGLKKPFVKWCRFDKKNKRFRIDYPVNRLDEGLVETDYCLFDTLEEAEKEWNKKVDLFTAQHRSYVDVILYDYEPDWNSKNGSGVGFVFNWGVFRKVDYPDDEYNRYGYSYFYLRGGKNADGDHPDEVWQREDLYKKWKEVECTPEVEHFFETCTQFLYQFHLRLMDFFVHNTLDINSVKRGVPGMFLPPSKS